MNSVEEQPLPADANGTAADGAAPKRRTKRRWVFWSVVCAALIAFGWEANYVLLGPNFHCVVPGQAYRSAQPDEAWLRRTLARESIRSVVNLRGECPDSDWYVDERRTVLEAGGAFENVMLSAAFAPHERDLRRLMRVFDALPKPVLIHCRAGADRSGLAATLYVLLYTDTPIATARRQLSWRYGHIACSRSACLQDVLDQYEDWLARQNVEHQGERLREWIRHVYHKKT